MGGARENAGKPLPQAACDRDLPAAECLAWHVAERIPGAILNTAARSLRCRCPRHDDRKPSLVISVGDRAPLVWHCHACGDGYRLEIRYALIGVYGLSAKCLPMTRIERAEQDAMINEAFASPFTPCTKLVCVKALLEGVRGPLPSAPALVALGSRAGVSRAAAFRAARDLGGVSLNHLFVSRFEKDVKNPSTTPVIRRTKPVSNGDSISDGDSRQYQIETGAA